jgi:hypothetical protein
MGKWWWRYTEGKHRYLIYDSDFPEQSNKEIAKLGTEDWEPMLKVVEE